LKKLERQRNQIMGYHGVRIPPGVEFVFSYPDHLSPQFLTAVEVVTIVIASALAKEQVALSQVEVCPQEEKYVELRFSRGPGDYFQLYAFSSLALYNALKQGREILDGNGDEQGLSQWTYEEIKRMFSPFRVF
jgi:hypothetical protein